MEAVIAGRAQYEELIVTIAEGLGLGVCSLVFAGFLFGVSVGLNIAFIFWRS